MNNFKSIIIYCLIFVFLLSLTSSFEANDIILKDNIDLNIGNDVMYEMFYGTLSEDNSSISNDEENDVDNVSNENTNPKYENIVEANLGDSGENVLSYQKILYYLDYIQSTPDGNFDDKTKEAIESYQNDKELLITGSFNRETIISLLEEDVVYKQGKKGDEILKYQLILYYLDYINVYPIGGNYGDITKTAVQNYQSDYSLDITGNLDNVTRSSILEQQIVYKKDKKGTKIKEYQEMFISMGYLSGNADGEYGNMTVAAVKEYQLNNNLEQTGEIDVLTQQSLERPLSSQKWK